METVEILHGKPLKCRRILLHQDIMMKDVEAITYRAGVTAGDELADKLSGDFEDALDGAVLSAIMDQRESVLRKRLSFALMKEDIYEVDNSRDEDNTYVYDLVLSADFPDMDLKTAARKMNDYIVKGTLLDWYNSIGAGKYGAHLVEEVNLLENDIVIMFRKPAVIEHGSVPYMPSTHRR